MATTHESEGRNAPHPNVPHLSAAEVAEARAGSGRLVLLRGPTGSGRTTLLERFADEAAAEGVKVLRVRCAAANPAVPYASVRRLLDVNHDVATGAPAPTDPGEASYPERLLATLCSYAAGSPLMLGVDDVHLADPDSFQWFTETARYIDDFPVLLVVTERSQYDIGPARPGIAHSLPPDMVRMHTLTPLNHAEAAAMVRAAAGPGAPDAWVDDCVRASARNPLLLRALLDDLRVMFPDGPAQAALPESCAALYPGAYPAAVSWWLESAGFGTATVARTLAELADLNDDFGTYGLLAWVTRADPGRIAGWVTAMIRLGMLRRDPVHGKPAFAHPLLGDAVLERWSSGRRQAVHSAAAGVRYRRESDSEEVAGHLLRTPLTGALWAADVLGRAAKNAAGAGRSGDAARYLRRALAEPMPRGRRAAVLTELGTLEVSTREPAGIPRLAEALSLQDRPGDQVKAAVALGAALSSQGEARAALTVLRDLEERLPETPALIRSVRAASLLLSDHDREVRQVVYARLRRTADESPALFGPSEQALLIRFEATAGLLSSGVAMRRIRALLGWREDPALLPYLLLTSAAVAQWADELDEAERLVETALGASRATDDHLVRRALVHARADTFAAREDHAEAVAAFSALDRTDTDTDADTDTDRTARRAPSNRLAHRLLALVGSGRAADARGLAPRVALGGAHDGWETNRYLYARGVQRAAANDPSAALDDFLECGRRQSARDVMSPCVTPWRTGAADCLLALGRPEAALALAEEERRLAAVWATPRVVGRALRVLGEATGGRRGLELTAEAVSTLRGTVAQAELVTALTAHGRQLTAMGRGSRARPPLREAAALAEHLGAVHLRARALTALRAGGARPHESALTGVSALTGSEARTAGLASDGLSNAEIADLLHVARRTVETHLTSVYRKLDIRGRADLPAALHTGEGTAR